LVGGAAVGAGEVLVSVGETGVSLGSVVIGVVGSGVGVAVPVAPGVWLPSGVRVTEVGSGVTVPVTGLVAVGIDVDVGIGGIGVGGGSLRGNHSFCPGKIVMVERQLARMSSSTEVSVRTASL
jgi:hypothetical protein